MAEANALRLGEPGPRAPWRLGRKVWIGGMGTFVPDQVLDNAELERRVATTDAWIVARTGIRERRIARKGQSTSDLAAQAGARALSAAGLSAERLDLIVVATASGDSPVPATACHVQRRLGATRATAFDVASGCTGFVVALMTAHGLISTGGFEHALVVGAEVLSSITDYAARETCVLLGDGAGAVILGNAARGPRLVDHLSGSDGRLAGLIRVPAGGSVEPASHESVDRGAHFLEMRGREVFRFAVRVVPEAIRALLDRHGLAPSEVSLFVPHQANLRIIEAIAQALDVPMHRFAVNLDRLGNTSAASVPMALEQASSERRLEAGEHVMLVAFGAGMSWGATLLEWS